MCCRSIIIASSSIVLAIGSAFAATSPPDAEACIRAHGPSGRGHDDARFWGYFKNQCEHPVSGVAFDALLYWCRDQNPPGGQCYFAADLRLAQEITTSFGTGEVKRIEVAFPGGLDCGFYQWDINLKPHGCTSVGDCFARAQGLPATWGEIFARTTACAVCVPGDAKACIDGCGQALCGPDGQWDDTTCGPRDACGQCPGTGAQACCAGPAPTCGACEEPRCTDAGWVCDELPAPACAGCKRPLCDEDGTWRCVRGPLPDCGPCGTPICGGGEWTCAPYPAPEAQDCGSATLARPADVVATAPSAVAARGTDAPTTSSGGPRAEAAAAMDVRGGCAVSGAAPRSPPSVTLLLVAIACRRRRRLARRR